MSFLVSLIVASISQLLYRLAVRFRQELDPGDSVAGRTGVRSDY